MDNKLTLNDFRKIALYPEGLYSFRFARTHYLIPAWYTFNDNLFRVLRLGENFQKLFLLEILPDDDLHTKKVEINIASTGFIEENDLELIQKIIIKSLRLDSKVNEKIIEIAKNDPIVSKAIEYNGFNIRGKLYPNLFEALCGVICAQRTAFSRIPNMMGNMGFEIAPRICYQEYLFPAFPTAFEILNQGESALKKCGVGFRAKRILQLSQGWIDNQFDKKENYGYESLKTELLKISGIGDYTANLALNLCGMVTQENNIEPHIDSFVQSIIGYFYFNGETRSEEDTRQFVLERWGNEAEEVISYLTTDTHEWAAQLNVKLPVQSGAKAFYKVKEIEYDKA